MGDAAKVARWENRDFATRTDWAYEVGFDFESITANPQFADVDGIDGMLGFSRAAAGAGLVIDDGDGGFSTIGAWTPRDAGNTQAAALANAVGADFREIPVQGGGDNLARWTFAGLQSGLYEVVVSWPTGSGISGSSSAPFTIYDGVAAHGSAQAVENVVGYTAVSQQSAPSGYSADGRTWRLLDTVSIVNGQLVVDLRDIGGGSAAQRMLADAVRIQRIEGDHGADDDFHLLAASPAVDRGDPRSAFSSEPAANGSRIDLGAYGNTPGATPSPAQLVQVLNPNGLEKFEVGQAYSIEFRSAGLALYDPVALVNAGGAALALGQPDAGNWLASGYLATSASSGTNPDPIAGAGEGNAAPLQIYQSYAAASSGVNNTIGWNLPLEDGSYVVRLHFAEPSLTAANQRLFDVSIEGATVSSSLDVFAEAGGRDRALVKEYAVNVADGNGLSIALLNRTGNPAFLNGIEILRANPDGASNPTADLEVSLDNGASWVPIASGLALDRYGQGRYTWTPDQATAGNSALIRVTGHAGDTSVQDTSDEPFLVANGGTAYYVNDGSLTGDEYATAAGSNANSGKSASAPMASLAALLRAYDLRPGDVIYVDSGTYTLATNIVLGTDDFGFRIQGPVEPNHVATLNRGNTSTGSDVFTFSGASDITMDHLALTGGQYGIRTTTATGNDRITLSAMDIYGNTVDGVAFQSGADDWLIQGGRVHNNGSIGIEASGARARITGVEIYGNSTGASLSGPSEAARIVASGNDVHDNGQIGISLGNYASALGNRIYNHRSSSGYGVYLTSSASLAQDNDLFNNNTGAYVWSNGTVDGNRVFSNTTGVYVYSGVASRNHVYSNTSVGLYDAGYSEIWNNVVYANGDIGIHITYTHTAGARGVYNNTVWQDAGDALRLSGTSNVWLRNNILSIGTGYAINVADAGSQAGFSSNTNLFDLRIPGSSRAGLWSGVQRAALADWQSISANHDANSKVGAALFLDIDGADNVLGYRGVTTGDGYDDNFGLDAGSPAIDAGNAYEATLRDIEDRPRHDDPSTANTGAGWDLFVESETGANGFDPASGTPIPLRTSSGSANVALPFAFSFYGRSYTSVQVSANGFLHFGGPDGPSAGNSNTLEELIRNVRIAPLWDNLTTGGVASNNVFVQSIVDPVDGDRFVIRWAATREEGGAGDTSVNFAAVLYKDGRIRFDYGGGNVNLTPTIGLSAGNGFTFVTSDYNGQSALTSANSVLFTPTPGLTYFDIGAYEFQGNSGDTVLPQVTEITKLPEEGGTTALAFSSIQVSFTEPLDGISARSPANFELRRAGLDGLFDTTDDVLVALKPAYSFPETSLTLDFLTGVLPEGEYRLTLSGTKAIYDLSGNPLDGAGNGGTGEDYIRTFIVDRSTNVAPVANAQSVNVAENTPILITLTGSDANGDPLTYVLTSNPAHGALSGFDPVARTVLYTPSAGYNGPDSFQFMVDDGKTGVSTATIGINVQPINAAPVAGDQSVTLEEDSQRLIVLIGSDPETARANLTFTLVSAPEHGTLAQGAAGGWTYAPDPGFDGIDSFTYTVTDRGDPDGSGINAITTAPATVSITVTPVNDAPEIAEIADRVVQEGSALLIPVSATDEEGDAITYSLDAAPAGMLIDAGTGLISWSATDGPVVADVTVRVTDAGSPSRFATRSFQVTVVNVAPQLDLSGDGEVLAGETYVLNLAHSDPGEDTLQGWEINWGDGNVTTVAGGATSVGHVYVVSGAYDIAATAIDEDGSYAAAPLSVNVISPNAAPVAQPQTVNFDEDDGPVAITLSATDADGDALTFSIVSGPGFGTLGAIDPVTHQVAYTPNPNFNGNDSFVFRVADGKGGESVATVALRVTPVNDVPTAAPQAVTLAEDDALVVTLGGSDVETLAADLVYTLVSGPAHGSLAQGAGGVWTYTPAADYNGPDSFVFTVTDTGDPADGMLGCGCPIEGSGFTPADPETSAPITITIAVTPVNDAPVLAAVAGQSATEGDTVTVSLSASDVDAGDTLTYELVSGPAGASVDADTGVFTWTAADGPASVPVTVRVTDQGGLSDDTGFTIEVAAGPLHVTQLIATDSGFRVQFNRAFDATVLNLYDGQGGGFGAADVVVSGPAGVQRGTLIVDADLDGFEWVRTGAAPASGSYTVRLASGAAAFKDASGGLLDGNGDGSTGDDYVGAFTVSAPAAVLSVADVTRGPGQAADVPATAAGIPIRLDGAGLVSTVAFELHYDASLLEVTGFQVPAGATFTPDASSQPGVLKGVVSFATPVSGNGLIVGRVIAQVPGSAAYGAKHVLDLRNVAINGGAIAARADDGVHAVVFAGDASGDASYATLDVQRLQRVAAGADTGFSAWPLVDPHIVGDVNNLGGLTSADTTILTREIAGFDRPEIPPLPAELPAVFFSGPDPLVNMPRGLSVPPGGIVDVPVNLDTAAGLEAVQLRLAYDADALELLDVRRGSLTGDFQWFVPRNTPGLLVVDMTRLESMQGGSGSLLNLRFRAKATAPAGDVLLDLQWVTLNEDRLTLNPAPVAGADPTDGVLHILPALQAAPAAVAAPAVVAARSTGAAPAALALAVAIPDAPRRAPAPVIDFSPRLNPAKIVSLTPAPSAADWKTGFVTELGRSSEERDPNERLRVAAPGKAVMPKLTHRAAVEVKPTR